MTKKSIRNKLFLYVTFIFLSFVIAIYAFNSLLLPTFYLSQKRTVLIKQAEKINSFNVTNYVAYYDVIEEMTLNSSTELVVYNEETGIVYESFMKRYGNYYSSTGEAQNPPPAEMGGKGIEGGKKGGKDEFLKKRWWNAGDSNPISTDGIFISSTDPELQVESLIFKQTLSTGDIVAVRVIVGAIEDSIHISNIFLLLISIIFLFLALIITYYFSKRFTKPIIEMQQITTRLRELDFSQTYQSKVKEEDELGMLGENINKLSTALSRALSELKTKNEQLVVELEKERQLDSLRRTFISNVSHELKTPLAIIESYAEGIQLGIAQTPEKQEMYSNIIIEEISHMTNLLDSILDLSQIEAGVLKLTNNHFSLKTQIRKVIQAHEVVADKKECKLIFNTVDKEDIIDADSMRVQQVIRNFVKNAINHAEIGTDIIIDETIKHGKVYVSVKNVGIELTDVEIKNIWNQFYKKDTSRTINRVLKQHGLGLSIVKGVLDLYPDAVYGTNRTGNGMSFWFALPLAKHDEA